MAKEPIINLPNLYCDGFKISWASNTTLTVAAGQCRDSSNVYDMTLSSAATINAAINGVNGLDTGTFAASTCYAVLLIGDSSGFNATKCLLSLSATAPTLPVGYDIIRRIGWAFSDSSTHFILAYQSGSGISRMYFFDAPVVALTTGSSATFAAIDLSNKVPAQDNLRLILEAGFTPNAAADIANIRAGGSSATSGYSMTGVVAGKQQILQLEGMSKLVAGVPKVEYKVAASGSLNLGIIAFSDAL
jgi:hypothetical protein